jgi:hypothetical protein
MVAEKNQKITSVGELPFYDPTIKGSALNTDQGFPLESRTESTTRVLKHPQDPNLRIIEYVDVFGRITRAAECTPKQVGEYFKV